jgi:hypothetical protein
MVQLKMMGRLFLVVIVSMLTWSSSGIATLVISEPCTSYEQAERDDDLCPPTCVTCGCCAQAVEPMTASRPGSPEARVTDLIAPVRPLLPSQAFDIFHVPKPSFA